jgi:hypothetical protein
MLKNSLKKAFWGRYKGFKLLYAIFNNFVNFWPSLVDFLLNKRFFERVGGLPLNFLAEWVGMGPSLNSDLRPTMPTTGHSSRCFVTRINTGF